jgi:hypothetical protein
MIEEQVAKEMLNESAEDKQKLLLEQLEQLKNTIKTEYENQFIQNLIKMFEPKKVKQIFVDKMYELLNTYLTGGYTDQTLEIIIDNFDRILSTHLSKIAYEETERLVKNKRLIHWKFRKLFKKIFNNKFEMLYNAFRNRKK